MKKKSILFLFFLTTRKARYKFLRSFLQETTTTTDVILKITEAICISYNDYSVLNFRDKLYYIMTISTKMEIFGYTNHSPKTHVGQTKRDSEPLTMI